MKIGIYQNEPEFGEIQTNVEKTIHAISGVEADLIVLPELFNTGYQFISRAEMALLSEEVPGGNTCRAMTKLARDMGCFFVFGIAEKDNQQYFNSAAVVGPDGFIGKYRKTHLFFEEKDFFSPGDSGLLSFDIGSIKIGIMICFDWWFPESARVLALKGAHIICHPANLVLSQGQAAMITRSLENGVFTMTANRVGKESRGGKNTLTFTGMSQVVDPSGNILFRLGSLETGVVLTDIDPLEASSKAITSRNDRFEDRRPEFYRTLIESQ